jgi:hypothetical protein
VVNSREIEKVKSRSNQNLNCRVLYTRVSHVAKSVTDGSHPVSKDDLTWPTLLTLSIDTHSRVSTYKYLSTVSLNPTKQSHK